MGGRRAPAAGSRRTGVSASEAPREPGRRFAGGGSASPAAPGACRRLI